MGALNTLSAVEAARQIASGKITSEALVRDCLERIAARDAEVQAWAWLDPEAALAQEAHVVQLRAVEGDFVGGGVGIAMEVEQRGDRHPC